MARRRQTSWFVFAWLLSSFAAAETCQQLSAAAETCRQLSAQDVARIGAVPQAYSQAWLRNDEVGVLGLFTDDAVLMPHHGGKPRVGMAVIKAFWFPPGGAAVKVTKFEIKTDEIGGSGDIAYARGRFTLVWTTPANGVTKTLSNAGTYLDILRRQPDGSWKITHHMWDGLYRKCNRWGLQPS